MSHQLSRMIRNSLKQITSLSRAAMYHAWRSIAAFSGNRSASRLLSQMPTELTRPFEACGMPNKPPQTSLFLRFQVIPPAEEQQLHPLGLPVLGLLQLLFHGSAWQPRGSQSLAGHPSLVTTRRRTFPTSGSNIRRASSSARPSAWPRPETRKASRSSSKGFLTR